MSEKIIISDESVEENDSERDYRENKLVYLSELLKILEENINILDQELRENQLSCQICAGYVDDPFCQCIKSLEERSGKAECFTSASTVDVELACQKILTNATETIKLIKEKTFFCVCPPIAYKFKRGHFGNK